MSEEVNKDWKESPHHLEVFDCFVPLSLHRYSLPEECMFLDNSLKKYQLQR